MAKLYAEAQALRWHLLGGAARTRQYNRWLEEAEIGGLLRRFLPAEEARLWIKDGPMKEYARAMAGLGRWAKYAPPARSGAEAVVCSVCGEGWQPIEGTQGIKPLHCDASDGVSSVRVFWGFSRDFKHLLWAALMAEAEGVSTRIGVLEDLERPANEVEKQRHRWFAARCKISVSHVRLA